ncbi:hypothetical protein K469DRAFT_697501 [Zopfia rhizophila CBS 207.26]|uniref:Uncharacterized protein n=1 Tax=Zopfia rhizophila CBS 207.26 TaxID=1314779 RepID=A0A6A6DDJ3_9PEZI|nr:hypothetical protein K469DRAFT_697501 [Zopfia rhizophila CBS 207.26]
MASLASLPNEQLLAIVNDLGDDKKTLASLSATSRKNRDIAQPAIYRTISFHVRTMTAMLHLVRTLLDRPDLAAQVVNLSLAVTEYTDDGDEIIAELGSISAQRELVTKCLSYIHTFDELWDDQRAMTAWTVQIELCETKAYNSLLLTLAQASKSLTILTDTRPLHHFRLCFALPIRVIKIYTGISALNL